MGNEKPIGEICELRFFLLLLLFLHDHESQIYVYLCLSILYYNYTTFIFIILVLLSLNNPFSSLILITHKTDLFPEHFAIYSNCSSRVGGKQ